MDFKEIREGDKHLFIANDSKTRPYLMTGVAINVAGNCDAIVGLEFLKGGQEVLDGVFFGFGWKFNPHVELAIGYSRGLGQELSRGFRFSMEEHYRGTRRLRDQKDYDALPLYEDGEKTPIYPGNPIIDSFNSRISIGIMFRRDVLADLKKLLD